MKQTHLLAALIAVFSSACVVAQPAAPGGAPGGSYSTGHAGPMDPAKARQMIYDAIKEKMGVTEEQWDAILPKLEKVRDAQANARTGAGFGVGRAQGGVARAQMPPDLDTPLGHAMSDLRAALDDKDVTSDDLVKKMAAVREAREKALAELKKAQEDLKTSLTPRQEAVLMTIGQLD